MRDPVSPDVFVSYSKQDADIAGAFVKALESQGWSVWWDRDLDGGDAYGEIIERVLQEVPCVVLLWTANARASRWVAGELETAANRNVLVPVQLDRSPTPVGLRGLHWESLAGWKGDVQAPALDPVLRSVGSMIGQEPDLPDRAPNLLLRWSTGVVIGVTPFLLVGVVAAGEPRVPIDLHAEVTGVAFRTSGPAELFEDGAPGREMEASEIRAVGRLAASTMHTASHIGLYAGPDGLPGPGVEVGPLPLESGTAISVAGLDAGVFTVDVETYLSESKPRPLPVLALAPMQLELFDDATQEGLVETVNAGEYFDVFPSDDILRTTIYGRAFSIASNIAVDSLRLAELNERDPEAVRLPSGLRSGVIRLGGGSADTLGANDRMRISGLRGDLRTLEVDSAGLLMVEFRGTVASVQSVSGPVGAEIVRDLVGGPLSAFWTYERGKAVAAVALYVLVAGGVIGFWSREPVWWWTRRQK